VAGADHTGGVVYDSIDAPDATFTDRLQSWLPRHAYLPQPYEQLAGVYRQDGNERAARAVSMGKQRVMRARHRQWWIQWPSQAWSALLRWTIGYGYRPTLAVIPLVLLVIGGTSLFAVPLQFPDQLHIHLSATTVTSSTTPATPAVAVGIS
jgi:hypothetical protein